MEVTLLSFTPEPEFIIASAAKASTSKLRAEELRSKLSYEKICQFLEQLLDSGHLSPFEHVSFTFEISGISRACSHQLVRHRLASYTQQSQRYVSLEDLNYVTPSTIAFKPEIKAKFQKMVQATHELYSQMLEAGIPAEDARYVLPQAIETRLIVTMNARELLHAAGLRLCQRSQWEIRELFQQIKAEVKKVAPFIGESLQPKCYRLGYCDERESCGLFPTREEAERQGLIISKSK